MENKVIIVTGGSKGMGNAIAKKLVQEGAKVVITARTLEDLEAAKDEMKEFSGEVDCFQMDVREIEHVKGMVEFTKKRFGRIDGLVNNAAGNFFCPAEDLSLNGWNSVINIVFNGTWMCTQEVGKYWIDEGIKGNVLSIVSPTAWMGSPGTVHSASAKAGVISMMTTLAVEWGSRYGIRLNSLAPGMIANTGGNKKLSAPDEESLQIALENIPLKRFGQVNEIANLAYHMLSPASDYLNGECITLDGGVSIMNKRSLDQLNKAFPPKVSQNID